MRKVSPAFATAVPWRGAKPRQLAQQSNPQHLDFHGVSFAWSSGRMIGVHPCKVARAPNQSRGMIDANSVGCSSKVSTCNGAQDIEQGSILSVHDQFVDWKRRIGWLALRGVHSREIFTSNAKP